MLDRIHGLCAGEGQKSLPRLFAYMKYLSYICSEIMYNV